MTAEANASGAVTEPVPTTELNLAFALGDHFVAGKIFLNYRRGEIPVSHRRSTGP